MPLTIDAFPATAAPVVVALHSSGASGRQWDPWRRLLPQQLVCHTPELMGYDAAGWPAGAGVTLDAEAQRLQPLLAGVPGGVHLIGHSYGGTVALQLALRWPELVRSLTVYEPVRFALLRDGDAGLWRAIVTAGREIGALALQGRLEDSAETFVDYWSGAGSWRALPPQRRPGIAARMAKVCAEFEALFADEVPASAYRALRMPVRVLCGSRSPRPALRVAERLVQACPAAQLIRLDGLGHLGPIEDAGRVLAQFMPQLMPRLPAAA